MIFHCCFDLIAIMINDMINDVEQFFMCTSPIYLSSLEKCQLKSFVYFIIGLSVFLLLICKSSLYILNTSSLSDMLFANIFSPFCRLSFLSG